MVRNCRRKGKKVVEIDYDSTDIAIANGRGRNAEFKLLDINDGMKDLGKFNVAILIHLLEHIDNPQVLLASLRSNCDSLIIEVPDRDSNPLNWARIKMGFDYYTDADHVRGYSVGELREDLEKSGWHEFDYQCVGGSIIAKVK